MSRAFTEYELKQIEDISKWKKEEPGVISQGLGLVVEPMSWVINKIIPEVTIRGILDGANFCGEALADKSDILRDGNVWKIADLKYKNLELSDKLANEVHDWAIGFATAEGAAAGYLGLPGLVADIPIVITTALRTIHKIGMCYGYEASTEVDKKFILGIMAASGANTTEEKTMALLTIKSINETIAKQTWKKINEKAAQNVLNIEAAIVAIRNLAKQLGINLTKRKALAAIPVIGAVVGGSANGWYLKEVGWAARRSFQERWLNENHYNVIIDI